MTLAHRHARVRAALDRIKPFVLQAWEWNKEHSVYIVTNKQGIEMVYNLDQCESYVFGVSSSLFKADPTRVAKETHVW